MLFSFTRIIARFFEWEHMADILWRAIAFAAVLIGVCVCADALRHESFDSGVVGTVSVPHYFVRCEAVDFRRNATIVTVRVFDESPFPQFQAFRRALQGPAPYLDLPPTYSRTAGRLRFVHYEELPDLVVDPKPTNDIHEAIVKVTFDPIGPLRADPMSVDKVYLKFPALPPFTVSRRAPLSQSQDPLTTVHNFIVSDMPPLTAAILLTLGAGAFCGLAASTYRQREILIYRWKLKQLAAKGELVVSRKGKPATTSEGDVLAPPRWDEHLIATQFRNLQHRPAMLAVFMNSVKDRFILNQDERTAAVRIAYLKTKLEELKVSKELQREIDDLEFRETDLDIRRMEQELKKGDIEHRLKTQAALREAEHKRDLLRVKLETGQLGKQIRDLKPQPAAQPPTRAARIQDLRERIQRAKEERAYARETASDPDEVKRRENLCDDKIARLEEELSSLT